MLVAAVQAGAVSRQFPLCERTDACLEANERIAQGKACTAGQACWVHSTGRRFGRAAASEQYGGSHSWHKDGPCSRCRHRGVGRAVGIAGDEWRYRRNATDDRPADDHLCAGPGSGRDHRVKGSWRRPRSPRLPWPAQPADDDCSSCRLRVRWSAMAAHRCGGCHCKSIQCLGECGTVRSAAIGCVGVARAWVFFEFPDGTAVGHV